MKNVTGHVCDTSSNLSVNHWAPVWVFRDCQSIYNKELSLSTYPCSCFTLSYLVFGTNVLDYNCTMKPAHLLKVQLQRKSFKCSRLWHSVHGCNLNFFQPWQLQMKWFDFFFLRMEQNSFLLIFWTVRPKIWTKSTEFFEFWSKGRCES